MFKLTLKEIDINKMKVIINKDILLGLVDASKLKKAHEKLKKAGGKLKVVGGKLKVVGGKLKVAGGKKLKVLGSKLKVIVRSEESFLVLKLIKELSIICIYICICIVLLKVAYMGPITVGPPPSKKPDIIVIPIPPSGPGTGKRPGVIPIPPGRRRGFIQA